MLEILTYPDPRLYLKAALVNKFDRELTNIIDHMATTMYTAETYGLAPIQVNIQKSIIVTDISEKDLSILKLNLALKKITKK